ncbi:MAG TPA: glycosyltransferase, partial [Anaerolineaceae bacterium]
MTVAFLHYTAPPVVGGVEAVMLAHARIFSQAGVGPVRVIAGQGDPAALPEGVSLVILPEMDSRHPAIAQASRELEQGRVPPAFESLSASLEQALAPALADCSAVIIHNIFTKHFNLPLTAALDRLRESGGLPGGIAWCHDFTWTSPHSRAKVQPGYPWDLLRTRRPGLRYVTVSEARRRDLAELLDCPVDQIQVIYNGVSPQTLWMLSPQGQALVERLRLLESDLVLLMPVRVTQAKNIELALQVTAAIKRQGLQPRLIVSGPPDPHDLENMVYFQGLQRQRDELGLQAEAHFVYELGEAPDQPLVLDEEQVAELYRASDLMFMPSRREGFGMPVLEAGLVGLPVASSDVPAVGEIGGEDV